MAVARFGQRMDLKVRFMVGRARNPHIGPDHFRPTVQAWPRGLADGKDQG